MDLKLGVNSINKLYLVGTPINKAYLGAGILFSGDFSPASLFAGGIAGAWYGPSDLSTLFQDSAGTTPVTTAGQPVGLMLDKSKVLGPELVTNGTFESNLAGWSVVAPCTMARVGSTLESSRNGGGFNNQAATEIAMVAGKTYIFSADLTTLSDSNGALVLFGAGRTPERSPVAAWRIPTPGKITAVYTATVTETAFLVAGISGSNSGTAGFDNISVRELPGNHASQPTAAARPTYQVTPSRLTIDKVDDRLSVTVPAGGFTGTMVLGTDQGTASYGVTIPAGAYDIGGRGGLYFPGNAIVGQLIRDGALSAGEAAATEAYFVENGATAGYGSVTDFAEFWRGWSEITSFPLIDTSSGTSFGAAWLRCSSLTSFPLIDTSAGTSFDAAWRDCSSLTSFPLIDTSAGTHFNAAWLGCTSLTSFPLIDTSAGTNFSYAWYNCNSLTSFPLIDTSAGTGFSFAWRGCSSLTSFPLIDTSAGTSFRYTWYNCNSLTSFPLIDTSAGTDFRQAWKNCTSLTSFPLIDTSAGTNFYQAWLGCSSLTSFPANIFDNVKGGIFTDAFTNTALTQTSIDNILVSLVTSGIATGTRVFDQSGGSAPSSTGEAAIDTLRSRGWTVTVTGGF